MAIEKGDLTCVLSTCTKIIAQVSCVTNILQGATGCMEIQFFGKDGLPLDIDRFTEIQILLYNELDCGIINFWHPAVPSGKTGAIIDVLQTLNAGIYTKKGLVKICLSKTCTATSPANIFAEIRLTELVSGKEEIYGISCLNVAKILESKIHKNINTNCE
tara:strand:+ start:15044 stop:15523 length:480 start_codon:yes stop_codon:yes gene_type:complete